MTAANPRDVDATTRGAASTATNGADCVAAPDGTWLRLSSVGPEDRDRIAALFAHLSPQSRYRRFLSPKAEVTPRELSYFTDIDHVHQVAIAAIDARGSMLGLAQYAESGQPGVADIALVVADELQSAGIGTALASCAVERARGNGLALLTATTLRENRPARALLQRFGFRACTSDGNVIELGLVLDANRSAVRVLTCSDSS